MGQSEYTVTRIDYGEFEYQYGKLYLPKSDGLIPLIILIHGGFWRAKFDLTHIDPLAEAIVKEGFAVWNIEYRRVGHEGGAWPGTLTDCARATDFVYELKNEYPIDINSVIAMGHSAGGHLALWLGSRNRVCKDSPLHINEHPFPLKGIVGL